MLFNIFPSRCPLQLLKLYFRTPTMPSVLLESCLADLLSYCEIDTASDRDEWPGLCDVPPDVTGRCAGLSIGGTPSEQEDLVGCAGVTFLIVDAIKRCETREKPCR